MDSSTDSTGRLCNFVESFKFEDVPEDVIEKTKELLCAGLGAGLSATASHYDIGNVLATFADEVQGKPVSQVIGMDLKIDPSRAALLNGTLCYYCDTEPHHAEAIMHAVAVVVPAALAVGDAKGASGKDVLAAIVLGIDVACRMSEALHPQTLYARGFHPTGIAGSFGSAAAAAHLLGLRGDSLRAMFGLAGTMTSGLLAWADDDTEHSRPFNMGQASYHGTAAALLAASGFGGPPRILEGKYPLGEAFTGSWREAPLFDDLGDKFKVMDMYFKRYSCCAFLHPGLDGLLELLEMEEIASGEVSRITLQFPVSGYRIIDNSPLRSHNAQYILSLATHRRTVNFHDVINDRRQEEPEIAVLAGNVEVIGDRELDKEYPEFYTSTVSVETIDQQRYERTVRHPRGAPENPMTREELEDQFLALTDSVMPSEKQKSLAERVWHLEDVTDIQKLTGLLAPSQMLSDSTS